MTSEDRRLGVERMESSHPPISMTATRLVDHQSKGSEKMQLQSPLTLLVDLALDLVTSVPLADVWTD